jgi:hypothetical protein
MPIEQRRSDPIARACCFRATAKALSPWRRAWNRNRCEQLILFRKMPVETDFGTDEDIFGVLHHTGKRALRRQAASELNGRPASQPTADHRTGPTSLAVADASRD